MSGEIATKKRRWRPRFRIWVVMVVVLPLAAWLALISNRARQQVWADKTIQKASGTVYFDYRWPSSESNRPGPEWVDRWFGGEYFRSIDSVDLGNEADSQDLIRDAIAALEACPDLHAVSLTRIYFNDADLEHVSRLRSLRTLKFIGLDLRGVDLSKLASLQTLRSLYISRSILGDDQLKFLSALPGLQKLHITYPRDGGIGDEGVSHMAGLSGLEELVLTDNPGVGDAGCRTIAGLSSLKTLELDGTGIGDGGVAQFRDLKALKELWLNHTNIGDPAAESFEGLGQLDTLRIRYTGVTKPGVDAIRGALPGLRNLYSSVD